MKSPELSRRTLLKTLGAATLGAVGANLFATKASFAVDGKTLKIRNDGDIRNLDPANRGGWYDETVMFAIYSGLVQYKSGDEWGWQLDAAETLEQTDPLSIPFKLKEGLQWTNGFGEVTAEDVKVLLRALPRPARQRRLCLGLGGARERRGDRQVFGRHQAEPAVRAAVHLHHAACLGPHRLQGRGRSQCRRHRDRSARHLGPLQAQRMAAARAHHAGQERALDWPRPVFRGDPALSDPGYHLGRNRLRRAAIST